MPIKHLQQILQLLQQKDESLIINDIIKYLDTLKRTDHIEIAAALAHGSDKMSGCNYHSYNELLEDFRRNMSDPENYILGKIGPVLADYIKNALN